MWTLIPRRANDGVDVRACPEKDAIWGFFPDIKRERGSYRDRLRKQKRRLTLKPLSSRSAAISEPRQGK